MRSQAPLFLLSLVVLSPALAQQAPLPQHLYKCKDASGRVYYTQVPPRECLGRDTLELNKSGTAVIKETGRAPTPAEAKAQEAERKKQAEVAEKEKEERRKNTALLNTYASERDIEDQRARALKEAQTAIEDTEKHIAGLQKRQKDLEAEKEFYTKKPIPPKVRQEISNNDIEIKNQTVLLESKKSEITQINAKYDEDKRRYVELTTGKK